MSGGYVLYSAAGSGGVAVEAALTLMGQQYELIEAMTFGPGAPDGDAVQAANPMRQVPALVLPDGQVMTESAAILIRLGELHPEAGLVPGLPLATARAMLPALRVVEADPAADAALLDSVADWAERYTPFVGLESLGLESPGSQTAAAQADGLVLDVTGRSDSLGVAVALQFLPLLLLGAPAGVLADRDGSMVLT